jgi:hypothetical protein
MNDFAERVKKRLDNYNKFIDGLFVDSWVTRGGWSDYGL